MFGFSRSGDRVVARLSRVEVTTLRELVDVVQALMEQDVPDNPVTGRLFPDASDDPETAKELRELLHDDLREGKRAAARALLASLPAEAGQVSLDEETAEQWLTALNDLRLALGTALGYSDELHDERPDDPDVVRMAWLGELQATLLYALAGASLGGEL